ncbi:MAG: hypothetical protein H8E27_05880 [Verrucomicrobia subdivision 3 bacterium]|nr:hypothetical protein [Limisphaerales bacterium]
MKKYILLNLTGLFVFFLFTCMFISCGKSGNPPASTKKKTTPQKSGTTQFTPQMVMEAIEYMAEKLPEEDREDFLDDSPLEDLYEATDEINEAMGEGALKVSEISGKALGEALYQKMFGSDRGGLSKLHAKANRLKCSSTLGQITKSMIAFAGEHAAFPWHLDPADKKHFFGKGNPEHLGTIFALEEIRWSLGSPKMLHSPCDPDRKAIADYKGYSARENKPIPHAAISYGLCPGSDDQLPDTIVSLTRNVSGAELKGATFLGNVMKGLEASQGNWALADGSVIQADNAGLKEASLRHAKSRGGIAPDPPSTKIWLPK